jgi:outer membrane protein OmpA-like peptidoglycan-associated protein
LLLGLIDLAWLDVNAERMSASAEPVAQVQFESRSHVVEPRAPTTVAPPPVVAADEPTPQRPGESLPGTTPPTREPLSLVILFERSLSVINDEQIAMLGTVADVIKNDASATVRIGGHADRMPWKANRGSNMTLSDDRAAAVVRVLGRFGVKPDRIRRVAFGDTRPVDDRTMEEAYRRNRRVEVRVEHTGDR